MTHRQVLEKFKEISHITDDSIDVWFQYGKNSIRVRLKDRTELIFTFSSQKSWRLETIDSYLEDLKRRKR